MTAKLLRRLGLVCALTLLPGTVALAQGKGQGAQKRSDKSLTAEKEARAAGRKAEPLAEGVEEISEEEFEALEKNGDITRELRKEEMERKRQERETQRAELRREFDKIAKKDAILGKLSEVEKKQKKPDGSVIFKYRDSSGKERMALLGGEEAIVEGVVRTQKAYEKPGHEKQIRMRLHEAIKEEIERGGLAPEALKELADPESGEPPQGAVQSRAALSYFTYTYPVLTRYTTALYDPKPSGYPSSCKNEEGVGAVNDHVGDQSDGMTSCSYSSSGLFQRATWPLKWRTTCVKDQGARGTCSGFATTAAVETRIAVQRGRWVNLSEQELYNKEKMQLSYWPNYGDGLAPLVTLMSEILTGHNFTWEKDWVYNPSKQRIDWGLETGEWWRLYSKSCNNYGTSSTAFWCSDTNHQAQRVCTFIGLYPFGYWSCGYRDPKNGSTGFKVKSFTPVLNVFDRQASADTAKAYLQASVPISFCFIVGSGFTPNSSGYVETTVGGTNPLRAHCILLTGFVPNSKVPSGQPSGSGGGYFVAKNSWGRNWGDCGYVYLPFDYVKNAAIDMTALNSVY